MRFRAFIRNEGTDECPWFVYVESPASTIFACRFGRITHAQKVMEEMNDAWRTEGRFWMRPEIDV